LLTCSHKTTNYLYLLLDVSGPYSPTLILEYLTLLTAVQNYVAPLLKYIPSVLREDIRYVRLPSFGDPHCQQEISSRSE
jgi:hypothetical protein